MSASPPPFEERLRVLDEAVGDLSRRLARLEHGDGAATPAITSSDRADTEAAWPLTDLSGTLPLVGRTIVVLGGAFLLRALAESGRVPEIAGLMLGLTYATAWNVAADRAAGARRSLSGLFHGLAALVIGLPIIIEGSVRFHSLTPAWSAVALLMTTGTVLAVSAHRRLPSLAVVASMSAGVTAGILVAATGQVAPFAGALVLLSIGVLWMSDALAWPWLRWAPALAADVLVAIALLRVTAIPSAEPVGAVIALAGSMVVAYGCWFGAKLGVGRSQAGAFEFTQTAALILLAAVAGAVLAQPATPGRMAWVGVADIGIGVASYGVAWRIGCRPDAPRANFHFFGLVGLALVLMGLTTVTRGITLTASLAAVALIAAATSARLREPAALLHGAAFTLAAAVGGSGLPALVSAIWFTMAPAWPSPAPGVGIVLASAVGVLALARQRADRPSHAETIARAVLWAILAVGTTTLVVRVAGPLFAGTPSDAGILASLETTVLAVGAVLMARASRLVGTAGLGGLAYFTLVLGALKLPLQDLRFSRPSTLFLALALYGIALIAVPRILGSSRREGADFPSST